MRECRRVFSRRSLLWLLVLMAAVVFFHRVDHHNAPGFAAAYRQTVAQLAASPDPSAALSQMEAESRRYMTALLWRSTDDPDLLELYRDQARQVLGDDYEAAAMAYDLSDQAQAAFTARQQAQQTLRQQLDYLASYPGYLDTIHENAANMPTLSIFMDSSAGKFHAENVKKTDRDFPRSTDVSLTLTETAGLENFLQDGVLSVCILLWMLVTVLRLTEERRSSLRYLVFGSPRGRTWLALRRVGILGLSAALGTALLMLTGLVTDSLLYGGLGDLSAAAQSSEIFQNFPYPLTLRQVLWAYCLLKALGMWLMGLLLWLILQLIHFLCIRCGVGLDHLLGIQLLRKFIHKSIHPFSSKHIRPSCEPFSVSTAPILPCFSHGYNQNPRNTAFSKHVRFYAICTICFSVSVLFRKIHQVFTSCS